MNSIIIKISISLMFVFLFLTNQLWGQEKKNSVNVSGSIAHYIKIEDFDVGPYEGYYKFPFSPGVEITYWRQIFPKLELGAGINFQRVHVAAYVDVPSYLDYKRRFRYNEISIPLLLKKYFLLKNQNKVYLTMGVYNGRQTNIISEVPISAGWEKWSDIKTIANYSDDHFFTDIYFDAGYSKSFNSGRELSIAPFFKRRVNSTWLNTYQERINWGVKLNYSFKF